MTKQTLSSIQVLPEQVINQIAAGEVVENSASVVKELVENSIDAGASFISVEIRGGGRQLIRIVDDGKGMTPDEAELALERHATSKIRDVKDLMKLGSMGFRGEALPSIASVSQFSLHTSTAEGPATHLLVSGGKLLSKSESVRTAGTAIEVKSLFFNVPARLKFLKSPAQDGAEVYKTLVDLALSHPEIGFELIQDGKRVFKLNPPKGNFEGALKVRAADLIGKSFTEDLIAVSNKEKGVKVEGFIGKPSATRPNRLGTYLLVNRRAVRSPLVLKAVREGYGTLIPPQRYPTFVLHLTLPPDQVDVNVHPQKREVRFRDEAGLERLLKRAVSEALQIAVLPEQVLEEPLPPPKVSFKPQQYQIAVPSAPPVVEEAPVYTQPPLPEPEVKETLHVLETLKGYILVKKGEQLLVVDQARASERLFYQQIKKAEEESPPMQQLRPPLVTELTKQEMKQYDRLEEQLNRLGFEVELVGPEVVAVTAVPAFFAKTPLEDMMRDIIRVALEGGSIREKETLLIKSARRLSLRRDVRLDPAGAEALLSALFALPQSEFCPSGEKIFLPLDQPLFEKLV